MKDYKNYLFRIVDVGFPKSEIQHLKWIEILRTQLTLIQSINKKIPQGKPRRIFL